MKRKRISEKDNFYYLLFGLVFLLFSSASVDQYVARSSLGQSLVLACSVISVSIAVWSLRSNHLIFNSALSVILLTLFTTTLIIVLGHSNLEFIHLILMPVYFLLPLKYSTQQALFSVKITGDNLVDSICIFLLLGLIWVMLYLLHTEFYPASFSALSTISWQDNFPDFVYFSFVVLTILGLGDLLPLSPLARFLVYMESVVGVFYMAIVVSSLVGAEINNTQKRRPE